MTNFEEASSPRVLDKIYSKHQAGCEVCVSGVSQDTVTPNREPRRSRWASGSVGISAQIKQRSNFGPIEFLASQSHSNTGFISKIFDRQGERRIGELHKRGSVLGSLSLPAVYRITLAPLLPSSCTHWETVRVLLRKRRFGQRYTLSARRLVKIRQKFAPKSVHWYVFECLDDIDGK